MATTTNFGWETPDDTDLVKDGAAAIRTLGSAIDTSLVDLKGGTTGQVLSKTSNTDMDFTWVTSDDANAIQNTIVDAKGDLIAASAADTPARLAVGNNGETLVADSSASTGLRWQGNFAAGKNFLINGGFDIWQRGTSSTSSATYATADRWYQLIESGSGTWAQETSVVPTGAQYSLKFTASSTSSIYPIQAIETLNAVRLAGKTVTFSGMVAASTSTAMSMVVSYSTSENVAPGGSWTNITATSGGTATPTSTTFVPISGVYDIPSTAKSVRAILRTTSTIANGVVVYWGNLQLEIGNVATAFTRAGGNIAGELAACQRYYYRLTPGASGRRFGNGMGLGATTAALLVPFPVSMRTEPTALEQSGTAADYSVAQGATVYTCSAVPAFATATTINGQVTLTVSSGLVDTAASMGRAAASGAYLGWSAEL